MTKRFLSRTPLSRWAAAGAVACAGLLSGCWGGDDDDGPPPVTSQVPASASETSAGFIAYLQALVVADADTLEPVDTEAVTPPGDDTGEPTPIG